MKFPKICKHCKADLTVAHSVDVKEWSPGGMGIIVKSTIDSIGSLPSKDSRDIASVECRACGNLILPIKKLSRHYSIGIEYPKDVFIELATAEHMTIVRRRKDALMKIGFSQEDLIVKEIY